MKASIRKDGDTYIVHLEGYLDVNNQVPIRENLHRIARHSKTDSVAKIIFNFQNLEFVGSSGISTFIQSLKEFENHSPIKPKYCHVRSEFRKIFKAFDDENSFEFFENEARARSSYDN